MEGMMSRLYKEIAFCIVCLMFSSQASSQTLEQTAAFFLAGGFAELDQIKQIDADSVHISFGTPMNISPFGSTSNASGTLKAIDRQNCIFEFSPESTQAGPIPNMPKVYYYLNNVILSESKLVQENNVAAFRLVGEEKVYCGRSGLFAQNTGCLTTFNIITEPNLVPRLENALKYLYTKFCTSAKRESAF